MHAAELPRTPNPANADRYKKPEETPPKLIDENNVSQCIISANIQGLYPMSDNTKVQRLEEICSYENAVALCMTETHLSENIKDAEIKMKNYTIFRQDRTPGIQRGGVITYIRNDLALNTVDIAKGSHGICEYQITHLIANNVLLINMYRPPAADPNDFKVQMDEVNRKIDELGNPIPTLILTRDFNLQILCIVYVVGRISKATPLLEYEQICTIKLHNQTNAW